MFALLPMKGNSERVPGKNLKILKGKPLFIHVASTLRETGCFEQLVINTDSSEIAQIATEEFGDWVRIIERDKALCGDQVSMNMVIEQDIKTLGENFDFFQTHSTNPLLSSETVVASINAYHEGVAKGGFDSLFAVTEVKSRLYWDNLEPLNHDPNNLIPTQDLPQIFEENSCIYIFSGASFLAHRRRVGGRPFPFVIPRNGFEAIDIDNPEDWDLVETVMEMRNET